MDVDRPSRRFRASLPSARPDFRSATWRVGLDAEVRPLHPTLVHALVAAAEADDGVGITLVDEDEDEETVLTFRALLSAVARAAGELEDAGVRRGDRVLVVLPTSFDFVATFLALEALGATPVPTYPPADVRQIELTLTRLEHIAKTARVSTCLTSRALAPLLGSLARRAPTIRRIGVAPSTRPLAGPAARGALRLADLDPTGTAFLQYTSGSTGDPKGVHLTHANVLANLHAIGQRVRISRHDVIASWLPLYHDMGLIGALLMSVYWRLPLVLMSPRAFLGAPLRWLGAITRHRATLSPAPNFAYALCVRAARLRPGALAGLDLSSWRAALNGAEPVNVNTIREFVDTFAPRGFSADAMLPVYGLAESSLAVTFPDVGAPLRVERVDRGALADGHVQPAEGPGSICIVGTGTPMPGHDVIVADEELHELDEREVGHVLVRGPSVMKGYFENADATEKVLRDGWLWTGDLGFKSRGELFVTGRVKDLIILRGKNYYAEDIEAVVERVAGVRRGGAVVFGAYDDEAATEMVAAVCEARSLDPTETARIADDVRDAVAEECGLTLDDVVVVPPGTLPKTSSGKRQRSRVRQMFLDDALAPRKGSALGVARVAVASALGHLSLLWDRSEVEGGGD